MLQYNDGYQTDLFIPLTSLGRKYSEEEADKRLLHIVSTDKKIKPVFIDGLELLERQHTSLLLNNAPNALLDRNVKDIKEFADANNLSCSVMRYEDFHRWQEVYNWRTNGIGAVSNASCHKIDLVSNEVIGVCGQYADSPAFKDFCADLQKDLNKFLKSDDFSYREMDDKINGTMDKINEKYPELNVMRMHKNEYAMQFGYIRCAKMEKESETKKYFNDRLGLLGDDTYVLYIQDNSDRRNIFTVKESQIKNAENLEEAVAWYAFGKEALDKYFGVKTRNGKLDYVLFDRADCYNLKEANAELIFPKDAFRHLDMAFYKTWEKTLDVVLKEHNVSKSEYFSQKIYEKDMEEDNLHKRGQVSLRKKVYDKSKDKQNDKDVSNDMSKYFF